MPIRLMAAAAAVVVLVLAGVDLGADQQPRQASPAPGPLAVAAREPLRLTIPSWVDPTPKKLGVLTIEPPARRGEMVRVSMPVGDLTMRAARAIGQAQYRRSEQKARKEVEQALKDFHAAQR